MRDQFSRTVDLISPKIYDQVIKKKIIVFGVGGVGSAVIEALVRFGFDSITFVDNDYVKLSNLNRQIFTKYSNVGMYKCLAMRDRINEINDSIEIKYFIRKVGSNLVDFNLESYDYVVDAIDMISSKLNLIEFCSKNKIPVISSMGTGNRVRADKLKITDIYKTTYDPLAKVIRKELKKRNIKRLKVVCSDELPIAKSMRSDIPSKSIPFSASYVPPVSGYMIAGEIIKTFIKGAD